MRRGSKFWALPTTDKSIVGVVAITNPLVALVLRRLGYGRTRNLLARLSPRPLTERHRPIEHVRHIADLTNRSARRTLGTSRCLDRSLTLWWLLRFFRTESEIRLGVARAEVGIDAHAWVEIDGVPINDDENISDIYLGFERPTP